MKPNRLALVRIHMIGCPVFVLGICRQLDGEDHWFKKQLFTLEEYVNCEDSSMKKLAIERGKKYHHPKIKFDSVPQPLKVSVQGHSFDFSLAEQVEITKEQREELMKELAQDDWMDFDWETWGK